MGPEPRKVAMNPAQVAAPIRPYYSNCVKVTAGPLLFISGQVAFDGAGRLVGKGDPRAQTAQALENIKAILQANGASMEDVVKVTVFVTDMRYFEEIAEVRMRYFPKNGPASTLVEVSKLALPDLLIEIEAVAVAP